MPNTNKLRLAGISYTQLNLISLVIPSLLLGFGYYLQYVKDLEPCPLCMTQRIAFYAVAIISLAALISPKSQFIQHFWAAFGGIFALLGAAVAGRQIWLQSLPEDQIPACGPSFEFIIDRFPLSEAISILLKGTGDCAEKVWSFLGLNIPDWSLLAFIGLALVFTVKLIKNP
ncbi:MAG: disulfide bond formation protein B [Pseudomonadales bacterium]|nr:disulfide bond formation protein B [Pseudomonadales bacterium]